MAQRGAVRCTFVDATFVARAAAAGTALGWSANVGRRWVGPRYGGRGPVLPAKVWPPIRKNLLGAGLHLSSLSLRRPAFVFGAYVDGSLVEVPFECPLRSDEAPCDVVQHGLRPRKTGPTHAIVVCHCHAHDLYFSVYPPGFVPYARRPLVDTAGGPTSFDAVAREAAAGVAWPRQGAGPRWWNTQRRLLRRLSEALGAFTDARDAIALAVGLPLRVLAQVADAVGFQARGRACVAALGALGGDLDRLLLAGAVAGTWGAPWRWQPAPARLVPLVPDHLVESIASTNSRHGLPPPFS